MGARGISQTDGKGIGRILPAIIPLTILLVISAFILPATPLIVPSPASPVVAMADAGAGANGMTATAGAETGVLETDGEVANMADDGERGDETSGKVDEDSIAGNGEGDSKSLGASEKMDKKGTGRKAERNDGLGIIDAVIICLVIGTCVVAIKSLAREGARRCAGDCSRCGAVCVAERNLAENPELRERLRRLKEDGVGE